MSPVDLVLLVCILLPALWGLWNGLIGGASGPTALAFAGFAAFGIGPEIARSFFGTDAKAQLIGAAIVFGVAFLWVRLLGALLVRVARIARLGWADHLGGALTGALFGVLAGTWLLLTASSLLPEETAGFEGSLLFPSCTAIYRVVRETRFVDDLRLDPVGAAGQKVGSREGAQGAIAKR